MDTRFSRHRFVNEVEDSENSSENGRGDSPRSSAVSTDAKMASTSSSKRSRRAIKKRVVAVPIRAVEGHRAIKGDQMSTAPPSDSWAWRKYGQKPIKGSPYPRGYYRCSSSKGCPARKQVERSRVDPKMLVVAYYCEHNHHSPASKASHHKPAAVIAAINVKNPMSDEEEEEEEGEGEEEEEEEKPSNIVSNQTRDGEVAPENKFSSNICDAPPSNQNAEFGWFGDFDSTSFTILESPMLAEDRISADTEMAMIFTMREEEELLFADLGELPECSAVFRRGLVPREAEQRRPGVVTTS